MDITEFAQLLTARFLSEGDLAVDATIGNGHDTCFLARQVGERGQVVGFDVQEAALESTRQRLENENLLDRVALLKLSHAEMEAGLQQAGCKKAPQAILFNLGYLPGSDKSVTTETEETLRALENSLACLASGGLLAAVLYPGHAEGKRETKAVLAWAEQLPGEFRVFGTRLLNRSEAAPCLVAVEKIRSFSETSRFDAKS